MTRRSVDVYLHHILAASHEAITILGDVPREKLSEHRIRHLALLRLLEEIGEAARRVSDETKTSIPEVPWRDMISTRNRLIHGYESVNLDILWDTVTFDLPKLANSLQHVLDPKPKDS